MQTIFQGHSIGEILISITILLGVLALFTIGLKKLNITLPDWVMQALGVILVVTVICVAIRFIMGL